MSAPKLRWRSAPVSEDFRAAAKYLALLNDEAQTRMLISALRRAATVEHAAKDLLRASRLPLLPSDEAHVQSDLKRIRKRKTLSPVLLIVGDMSRGTPLTVADGYHRICAVIHFDESAPVACRLGILRTLASRARG